VRVRAHSLVLAISGVIVWPLGLQPTPILTNSLLRYTVYSDPVNQVQRTPERQYTGYQLNTLHDDTTVFQIGLMDSMSSGLTSHLTQNVVLEILFPANLLSRRHILARRPRFPIKVTTFRAYLAFSFRDLTRDRQTDDRRGDRNSVSVRA